MPTEPSWYVRIWTFISAVIQYWQFWLAVAFMSERALERFFPRLWKRLDPYFTPERRRQFFVYIAIIAFAYGSFRAFDDVQIALRDTTAKLNQAEGELRSRGTASPVQIPFTVSKTADYQILVTDNGTQFDNNGATKGITFTLPPWARNLRFSFVVAAPWPVSVVARDSDKVGIGGLSVRSASSPMPVQLFSSMSISSSNLPGTWIVTALAGGWTMANLY
jgi:hypothetical protein